MIAEASVLVKGKDEECLVPLWGVADSFVDALDEILTEGDWRRRMEGLVRAALRVDVGELWQFPSACIGVELIERNNIGLVSPRCKGPVVESSIWIEAKSRAGGGVLVVDPRDSGLGELLEDGSLRQPIHVESIVILSVTMRSTRGDIGTIGIGRTWDGSKPSVEKNKILSHLTKDTDLVWRIVIDDLGSTRLVESIVSVGLFGHESTHVLSLCAGISLCFIRVVGTENWEFLAVFGTLGRCTHFAY